LIGTRGLCLH